MKIKNYKNKFNDYKINNLNHKRIKQIKIEYKNRINLRFKAI